MISEKKDATVSAELKAALDAGTLGAGFLKILPDGTKEYIDPSKIYFMEDGTPRELDK